MMIYCPECENACSEAAGACPKCGHPLQQTNDVQYAAPLPPAVQTTEQTGKQWKAAIVFGSIIMCVAAFIGILNFMGTDRFGALPSLAFLIGSALYVSGRIGAWWYHG